MRFARWTFLIAGVFGVLILPPMYLLEAQIGHDLPPAITHPEYYYGFIGVALACQVLYLVIARDPYRYRAAMLAGIVEKVSYAIGVTALFTQGRIAAPVFAFGMLDLAFGLLFVAAYIATARGDVGRRAPAASAATSRI